LWHPFMPFGWFGQTEGGSTAGILAAASLVFFAYRGFQNVSIAVEEARNPQRDIPIGVLASLAICTVIYLAVSGAITGVVSYRELNNSSPIAYALLRLGYGWGSALVATGVIVGLTSTMLALYYALTRILFAMGRDGLLPGFFSVLNSRTKTPINAVLLGGTVMAAIAGIAPLAALAQLANAGTLAEFILVCVGVIILRRQSGIVRSFRTPGGILIPLFGIASCTALLNFLPPMILVRYAAYLAAGFAVYFVYVARRRRSARGALGENPL
jgi:APA family basic amino acid/polyamine antiporter